VFSPEPMRHLSLVVLAGDLETTTRAIARVGVLHLLDVRHSSEMLASIRPFEVQQAAQELGAIARTVEETRRFCGSDAAAPGAADDLPEQEPEAGWLRSRADQIAREAEQLRARLVEAGDQRSQLENLARTLRALAPIGLPLEELRSLHYVRLACGLLPARNLQRLRESLTRVPNLILPAAEVRPDGRVLVLALCLRPGREALERALGSAQFQAVELPTHLDGTPEIAVAEVEKRLRVNQEQLAALEADRQALAARRGAELAALGSAIERRQLLLEARGMMGFSERTALLNGWVPAVLAGKLEAAVRAATGGRCLLQWHDPASLDEVRRGRIPVPILLRNPVLVRPFEGLLRAYGMPRYGDVEPTPIVALAFLTMFGFMFGDVGQGAVLFAAGYFIYREMFRYRDYALILMECGVFAMLFGVLYGSVFGSESWLPALWFHPMEDIPRLIRTAIAFGIALLSLGFGLNLLNALRSRDTRRLWEHNGLLAALSYWIAAGLFLRYLTAATEPPALGTIALWLGLPLASIVLKGPVQATWRAVRNRETPTAEGMLALFIESVVELLDTVISGIANTATFVRLAAFALGHAGLLLATFSVAGVVAHAGGGWPAAALVLVVGNLVIILLEGVIVAIQGIRLEYYEFFSRFYGGGGQEYRPLRLAPVAFPAAAKSGR